MIEVLFLLLSQCLVIWETLQQPLLCLTINRCSSEQQHLVFIHYVQHQSLLLTTQRLVQVKAFHLQLDEASNEQENR